MSDRLIFETYSNIDGYKSGANLWQGDSDRVNLYLKNACVSLISLAEKNPECDTALCTNIDVPDRFLKLLKEKDIRVIKIPYDDYLFPEGMRWSLTFYKFRVMEYLAENTEYDRYLMLDTDTYCGFNFGSMWDNAELGMLMCLNTAPIDSDNSKKALEESKKLYPDLEQGTRFYWAGGELAAKREDFVFLSRECRKIYEDMRKMNVETSLGDEFVWYVFDKKYPGRIIPGNAYWDHYWTYDSYYHITTFYYYDRKPLWHMPVEKSRGMLKLFDYYEKHRRFPNQRRLWHMLHLIQPDGRWYVTAVAKEDLKEFIKKMIRK
ncbi:MAG: hypothetical protein K6E33_07065 [Lachnospiraceae bacterium]|nr:hypothetical protein [Lachnospiraceae bacterium]